VRNADRWRFSRHLWPDIGHSSPKPPLACIAWCVGRRHRCLIDIPIADHLLAAMKNFFASPHRQDKKGEAGDSAGKVTTA